MDRIVFAINSLAGGGAERVFACIAGHSRERLSDRELIVALLDDEPAAYALPEWIRVVQFDARHRLLPSVTALRRLILAERPTALLSFLTRANLAAAWAVRGTDTRWVASERVDTYAHLGRGKHGAISRGLVRIAYPRADSVVAVSGGVADGLVARFGVERDRVSVIPNPVDVEHIRRQAADESPIALPSRFIAAMGRLVPNKNFELLLRAYADSAVAQDLVLMGEGPEGERLQSLAAALGCADRVHFVGFAANPFAILARAEFFVLPSNAEGFPNSLVEAMACGIPVVSTNCASGPSEILASAPREQITGTRETPAGIIVPPDDVAAMRDALRRMDNTALRYSMAGAATNLVQEYTVSRAVHSFWDIIDAKA
ncbi:glycosyltransferase [Stakelama saccharophila]|uniref:Glycosyltransferase n=1 Tax=Stakelama saccharophila TaxID=3075605 RepID=A0ABZ0BB68_9SPHN|nr:glycosyltransferase [Stakelama sp. W311]WNO54522.1 glycosyltransferase [Stakelama sp. W311]